MESTEQRIQMLGRLCPHPSPHALIRDRLEREGGCDAEVGASASDNLEEVCILGRAGSRYGAVCKDDLA